MIGADQVPAAPAPAGLPPRREAGAHRTPASWLRRLASGAWLAGPLIVVGAAMAWNLQGFPGRVNDDEGTYLDRGWAMLATHHLSNYTYYWDHPFAGWATVAAWAGLSDGFARDPHSVMVGRELMWLVTLVSCVLLYVLARRLGIRRPYAAVAVIAFGLSPLGIWYHRMVSLDNLATAWALGAFVLALSPRRSWAASVGSGVCFAIAFWNKETILLLLPSLLWVLWQRADPPTRAANVGSCCVVSLGGILFYPLLAVLKGELLPGPGHNSLWAEQIVFQLTRPGTGSLLDPRSGTYLQFHSWLVLDTWLIVGGGMALLAGFAIRRFRPFALALLLQVAVMAKGGYVPYAFVTSMLPFGALLIAGTGDTWWAAARDPSGHPRKRIGRLARLAVGQGGKVPVIAAAVLFAVAIAPHWFHWLQQQSASDGFGTETAAVSWVSQHVPAGDIVVCDAYPWLDIKLHSRATPLYLWQIDSDPQIMRNELPRGYRNISYLVLEPKSPLTFAARPGRPTLQQAISHSAVVKTFGSIVIYKVKDG